VVGVAAEAAPRDRGLELEEDPAVGREDVVARIVVDHDAERPMEESSSRASRRRTLAGGSATWPRNTHKRAPAYQLLLPMRRSSCWMSASPSRR
jgi:hypothetical protein